MSAEVGGNTDRLRTTASPPTGSVVGMYSLCCDLAGPRSIQRLRWAPGTTCTPLLTSKHRGRSGSVRHLFVMRLGARSALLFLRERFGFMNRTEAHAMCPWLRWTGLALCLLCSNLKVLRWSVALVLQHWHESAPDAWAASHPPACYRFFWFGLAVFGDQSF